MSGYTPIEKLEVTQRFEALSDEIWNLVMSWPRVAQNTIGEQLLDAADPVGANIAEGGYRESDPDALRHFLIARGSAGETAYFLCRATARGLIAKEVGSDLLARWESATQLLNNLIRYRRSARWKTREAQATYNGDSSEGGARVIESDPESPKA